METRQPSRKAVIGFITAVCVIPVTLAVVLTFLNPVLGLLTLASLGIGAACFGRLMLGQVPGDGTPSTAPPIGDVDTPR